MKTHTTREVSFHLDDDASVSCDMGWKRGNPLKTDRAQATQTAREGVAASAKGVLNTWNNYK